jgi:Flp pilus assembly protein TadD
MSWTLRPGNDVVLQVHLQPLGKPEPLQMEVGFYFTDEVPSRQPVKVSLIQYAIDLAPGASGQMVRDELRIPADVDLLAVLPHTHYLGRRVEAWATFPDGTGRSLFLIPDWDFNWQGDYTYARPVFLPAGTRVEMRVTFDNSTTNPRNPFHPPRRVRFGPDTTDEMAELWLQLLPRSESGRKAFAALNFERTLRDTLAFNTERIRIDPRDASAHVNRGRALMAAKRPAEAAEEFHRALGIDPGLDEAHYYLGLGHRMKGETAAATAAFRRAIEANPNHVRAHGNLGLLELEAGHEEVAAAEFSASVRLDPTDALATSMLGLIRYQQGRHSEALPLLEKAAALDPSDAQVREALGRLRSSEPAR